MFYVIFVVCVVVAAKGDEQRICATSDASNYYQSDDGVVVEKESVINNRQVTCQSGICFALWRKQIESDNSTTAVFTAGGCWESSGKKYCPPTCEPQDKASVNRYFCCCTSNLCNSNITIPLKVDIESNQLADVSTHPPPTDLQTGKSGHKKIILYGVFALALVLLLFITLLCKWGPAAKQDKQCDKSQNAQSLLQELQTNNAYSMAHITLEKIVGQGKYGTVWLAKTRDQQVAVKMFPSHYSQYFYNEKDIYTLPFMDHPALLNYFGSDDMVTKDGSGGHVLVFSYCEYGTLQDYLKRNKLDFNTFSNMALSVTAGLAHLHTEIHKQGKWKPCITHRDVNTRNILVKDDLTCCISDLGLAVKITGPHYYALGEEQHAETKSINDVGTLRYMAPEVLEGAVNLRDCESSLKQIDIYALGLVLWEMSMRVVDFFLKPTDVPHYALPFEKEVGVHPTFEEMQILVCRNKARPLFPAEWKNTLATRSLRETVDDCTDQDGEARLTVLCVHERISQLYKGSHCGNVSPTLNQTNFPPTAYNCSNINNNNMYTPDLTASEREGTDGCLSEGTVETIVTISPSESYPHLNPVARESTLIQPHQGRNPCLERNLLSCGSSEELYVVQTSNKHKRDKRREEVECLVRTSPGSVTVLQHSNAIPFVQNRPFSVPKQVNLPVRDTQSQGLMASLIRLIKKKDCTERSEDVEEQPLNATTHVIVSPFENSDTSIVAPVPRRPTSLQLFPPPPPTPPPELPETLEELETERKRLRELSGRIRTPGDLPPSVRRVKGSKARLSLYDDRMMSNGCSAAADSTF